VVRRDELDDERARDPPDLLLQRHLSPAADAHGRPALSPTGEP
jgi:hypothetical protein